MTANDDGATLAARPKFHAEDILEGTRLTHKTDLRSRSTNTRDRRPAPVRSLAAHQRRVVCVHAISVGPRPHRLRRASATAPWKHTPPGRGSWSSRCTTAGSWTGSTVDDRLARIHRGRDEDFGWLEERLEPLGFHVVLCTRRPETFEAARTERLRVSGKPDQYDDLGVFLHEQTILRRLAAASRLPVLELDMSDGTSSAPGDAIADWMSATGGLAW
jgi:hypothetical protein